MLSARARVHIIALLVATMWFEVLYASARDSASLSLSPWLAALVGLATQLAFTACEAAVATQAWRLAGAETSWSALAPRLFAISSAEALSVSIAAGHAWVPPAASVWLAGARAADGAAPVSGIGFAFIAFGGLTVARLLLSAHVQAAEARAPFTRALWIVLALYLATRLAMWWSFDLLAGRSFQSWGTPS